MNQYKVNHVNQQRDHQHHKNRGSHEEKESCGRPLGHVWILHLPQSPGLLWLWFCCCGILSVSNNKPNHQHFFAHPSVLTIEYRTIYYFSAGFFFTSVTFSTTWASATRKEEYTKSTSLSLRNFQPNQIGD